MTVTCVTVIVENLDRIAVYRPEDLREVLLRPEQVPPAVAVFRPEHRVWVVEQMGRTLWCSSRAAAWHAIVSPGRRLGS